MKEVGGLEAAARGLFFFYVLPEGRREVLTQRMVEVDQRVRREALREVNDVLLLLNDREYDSGYRRAFASWAYRMRALRYPEGLSTKEGMQQYLDFLVRATDPAAGELRKVNI